jgi:hypothetical protein
LELSYQFRIFTLKNHKRLHFLLRAACFFHFIYIAAANFRSAADFYARLRRDAGAGYQRGYIVGGKEKQDRETGRHSPPGGLGGKAAFYSPTIGNCQRIPIIIVCQVRNYEFLT